MALWAAVPVLSVDDLVGALDYYQRVRDLGRAHPRGCHDPSPDRRRHAAAVIVSGDYPGTRVEGLREESWGFRVAYVWDPSGVLLHFAESIARPV